jgi:lysophospholipase L1-like esterase
LSQYRSTLVAGVLFLASLAVSALPAAHAKERLSPVSVAWAAPASTEEPAGDAQPTAAPATTTHANVVAALGDSITDARSGGGGYVRALARMCPQSRFDAYGIGGQRLANLRARIEEDLFAPKKPAYTHVVIEGGVNDLLVGTLDGARLAAMEDDVTTMIAVARAHGVQPIVLTVPAWLGAGRDRLAIDDAFDDFVLERATAVDLRPLLGCAEDAGAVCLEYRRVPRDSVHWNARGHERVAEAIKAAAFADCE